MRRQCRKICSVCKLSKDIRQFAKEGTCRRSSCKLCNRLRRKAYSATLPGYITDRWRDLNSRTVNGSHPEWKNPRRESYLSAGVRLELSRDDLSAFCGENWEKISKMIVDGLKPVIDRIDPTGHYAKGNIQVISSLENNARRRPYADEPY